jgi:ribosomal protein L11
VAGSLADHLDAHAAGGALDDLHAGLDVVDVEVGMKVIEGTARSMGIEVVG